MIIAFGGRQGSGKTILSQQLINRGFIKVSFATKLKTLVSQLYNWDIDDLTNQDIKNKPLEKKVYWNTDSAKRLEDMIEATKPVITTEKTFSTRRQAMQYIGTEVLRQYDPLFHIKSVVDHIDPDKNYVIDDMRFNNEFAALQKAGATQIFVMRPYNFTYSNHPSEAELKRHLFSHVIINNRSEKRLLKKFNEFTDKLLVGSKSITFDYRENNSFMHPTQNAAYWAGALSACGSLKKCGKYDYCLEYRSSSSYMVSTFKYFLKLKNPIRFENDEYVFCVKSPCIIEDLKLWDLGLPNFNKSNDCIADNLLSSWELGVIDARQQDEQACSL